LTFLDDRTRTRRDHEKYLTLIDVIALLHQHQREVKTAHVAGRSVEYIEATLADIEAANAIAHEVLGRSLDELPPQTRRVLAALGQLVDALAKEQATPRAEVRFTRSQVRAHTSLSDTQCRLHLDRLAELEYLLTHRGQRGQSYVYELLHDAPAGSHLPHLAGLIDVDALKATPTTQSLRGQPDQFAGEQAEFAGPTRPQRGANAGAARSAKPPAKPALARVPADPADESSKTPISGVTVPPVMSYPKAVPSSAAAAAA
jgi:hypothetical protein